MINLTMSNETSSKDVNLFKKALWVICHPLPTFVLGVCNFHVKEHNISGSNEWFGDKGL